METGSHCHFSSTVELYSGFPSGTSGKESACNAGDKGLISGSERSPGWGHGNPLQYSCLESPMDRGAWCNTVHRFAKSWTWLNWLSMHTELKSQISDLKVRLPVRRNLKFQVSWTELSEFPLLSITVIFFFLPCITSAWIMIPKNWNKILILHPTFRLKNFKT